MLNAQKAKLIIAACLSFFVGTFLALYTKNLPTFGAGVLVSAYFLVEFLTMLKNSKADKYIKVTALAVNADESRAGFEPMETWRFIPVNEDGEYLDKNGKYDIFLQVKPRDREYHIGALYDMLFCAGDGERLTQDNLVAIEQNSVKANVQKEGLLQRTVRYKNLKLRSRNRRHRRLRAKRMWRMMSLELCNNTPSMPGMLCFCIQGDEGQAFAYRCGFYGKEVPPS